MGAAANARARGRADDTLGEAESSAGDRRPAARYMSRAHATLR